MNEQDVRKIIQDELNKQRYQAGTPKILRHIHDGIDSPKINNGNVEAGLSVQGSITFAHTGQYVIGLNFNPKTISFNGIVIGTNVKAHCMGFAQLGNSHYLFPDTTSSVVVGGAQTPLIQSSSYFSVDTSGASPAFHALVDEGHLVDVEYPVGTIHARMTIVSFNNSRLVVNVDNLDSGWQIIGNFMIS